MLLHLLLERVMLVLLLLCPSLSLFFYLLLLGFSTFLLLLQSLPPVLSLLLFESLLFCFQSLGQFPCCLCCFFIFRINLLHGRLLLRTSIASVFFINDAKLLWESFSFRICIRPKSIVMRLKLLHFSIVFRLLEETGIESTLQPTFDFSSSFSFPLLYNHFADWLHCIRPLRYIQFSLH